MVLFVFRLGVALPQPQPVSASSICAKIHADVFRRIHRAILKQAPRETAGQLWHGHRTFAVDGSKLNLPRPLAQEGYRTPTTRRACSAASTSCAPASRSTSTCSPPAMSSSTTAVTTPSSCCTTTPNASALFRDFILGDRTDHTVTVTPSADALRQRQQTAFQPCRVRLIKYTTGTTAYTLQELFAHFSLIALARLFTNRSEESFRADPGKPAMQANFKSSLRTMGAAPGRAVPGAHRHAGQDRRADPRRHRRVPPATAPEPLLPAPLPGTRQQMEVQQGNCNHSLKREKPARCAGIPLEPLNECCLAVKRMPLACVQAQFTSDDQHLATLW